MNAERQNFAPRECAIINRRLKLAAPIIIRCTAKSSQATIQSLHPHQPGPLTETLAASDYPQAKGPELHGRAWSSLDVAERMFNTESAAAAAQGKSHVAQLQIEIKRMQSHAQTAGAPARVLPARAVKVIQRAAGYFQGRPRNGRGYLRARLESLVSRARPVSASTTRLGQTERAGNRSPEYARHANYLDWLTSLPWVRDQPRPVGGLNSCQARLDRDHNGLKTSRTDCRVFSPKAALQGRCWRSIVLLRPAPVVKPLSRRYRLQGSPWSTVFNRFSVWCACADETEIKRANRRTLCEPCLATGPRRSRRWIRGIR